MKNRDFVKEYCAHKTVFRPCMLSGASRKGPHLPVGLLAQCVEYCTGIASHGVSILFKPDIFQALFTQLL